MIRMSVLPVCNRMVVGKLPFRALVSTSNSIPQEIDAVKLAVASAHGYVATTAVATCAATTLLTQCASLNLSYLFTAGSAMLIGSLLNRSALANESKPAAPERGLQCAFESAALTCVGATLAPIMIAGIDGTTVWQLGMTDLMPIAGVTAVVLGTGQQYATRMDTGLLYGPAVSGGAAGLASVFLLDALSQAAAASGLLGGVEYVPAVTAAMYYHVPLLSGFSAIMTAWVMNRLKFT